MYICLIVFPYLLYHSDTFQFPFKYQPFGFLLVFDLVFLSLLITQNIPAIRAKKFHAYFLALSVLALLFITLEELFFILLIFFIISSLFGGCLYCLRCINDAFFFIVEIVLLCCQVTQSI